MQCMHNTITHHLILHRHAYHKVLKLESAGSMHIQGTLWCSWCIKRYPSVYIRLSDNDQIRVVEL